MSDAFPTLPAGLSATETALRHTPATTEAQHQLLHDVLHQAPVAIAYLAGADYRIELANPTVCELWGRPAAQLLGQPLLAALPELQDQGVDALLDGVLHTGEPFTGTELPFQLRRHGQLETIYFNFVYHPQRTPAGQITGVLIVATDVTAQVLARQRVEAQEQQTGVLNEELAAINEELRTANEEIQASNAELERTQAALRELNEELEARVRERTQQVLRAQAATERQRQRLERLFMQAPAAVCILDGPELVYELVNPAYQQLFPGRHLLGKPLLHALPELTDQPVWHTLRRVYETGETHLELGIRIPLAAHEGEPLQDFYFNYIQQARYDEQGRVDGVLVFAFEVSAQVRAQQASAASTQQLQLITDALPVLIGYLDVEQRYRFANHAYEAWFNQPAAELLGRPIREIAGEAAYANIEGYLARALVGERVTFETVTPFRPDLVRHLQTTYIPDVRQGRVVGCFTLVNDVTEQRRTQEQVQQLNQQLATVNQEVEARNTELAASNQQLRRTNADLDNFIYSASHDLKAPISNIEGLLLLLREELLPTAGPLDADVTAVLGRMRDAVERFKRTIDHLTDVSKLQLEFAQPAVSTTLLPVLSDLRQDLAPLLAATSGQLLVDVAACPTLLISEKNLRSVLYNLLSNALKYHHPDRVPQVHVSSRVEGNRHVLRVQDNGLGLADWQQAKLFTLFQRLHTHVDGTGVGLYMVKKMVENAGGILSVQSQEGEGSTFTAVFPA